MIRIVSFGYKYRRPPKALEVFDCRSLPNPHRLAYLRDKTGLDEVVRDYVRSGSGFMALVDHAVGYSCHGDGITLAFGCVGGRHPLRGDASNTRINVAMPALGSAICSRSATRQGTSRSGPEAVRPLQVANLHERTFEVPQAGKPQISKKPQEPTIKMGRTPLIRCRAGQPSTLDMEPSVTSEFSLPLSRRQALVAGATASLVIAAPSLAATKKHPNRPMEQLP